MTGREAEQTLDTIRTLMERSTRYTNLSGHAGIAAGALAMVGTVLRARYDTPFLSTWLCVLFAALGATVYFTARMAHANGEPLWTRQAKTVTLSLLPAFICGLVMTAVLWKAGQSALLPGVWMLLWGVGALAMSFFTPRVITLLGSAFLVAGILDFTIGPAPDWLSMGLTFGLIHLVYGVGLSLIRRPALATGTLAALFRH